jgi:hypothetical protein
LHRDLIGFEPIFSSLEYAGEIGAPGRTRTDTLPGLSRLSLLWNTGAKRSAILMCAGLFPIPTGCVAFYALAELEWLSEEDSHRHRQIQSLPSYLLDDPAIRWFDSAGIAPATCALGVRCSLVCRAMSRGKWHLPNDFHAHLPRSKRGAL